ncbi:MAG: dodecin flavoprotein [Desulfuromonas sp.]|uniref:dodecin n=1 Tax=Desulfuromonas sp. TaxID=892 RepID=UPI000CBBBE24|nr:dodecin [Desulfuromonas sp.]PLX84348.1 MAG: dodecin flavoprotein [Desulfuromonas sp.]
MTYGQDRVYKKLEVIGVSQRGIEGAIEAAVLKAHQTLKGLSWFELEELHGHIGEDGQVKEYQAVIKVAFEVKD